MSRNNNFVEKLNLYGGVVQHNDFDIDENIPFQDQRYSYKQDILQIVFGDRYILDVGFYPEMNPDGHFILYAIQDYDWENPLVKIKCRSLKELKKGIEETAKLLSSKNKNS